MVNNRQFAYVWAIDAQPREEVFRCGATDAQVPSVNLSDMTEELALSKKNLNKTSALPICD